MLKKYCYRYIVFCVILFCSIQSLDRGGAITGRPSVRQQQQLQLEPRRVNSPVPGNTDPGGASITQKILNSLNVGYAITGPPTVQTSNRYAITHCAAFLGIQQ